MFYQQFSPAELTRLHHALTEIKTLFGPSHVTYGDHLITISRNLRFIKSTNFLSSLDSFNPTMQERSIFWRIHVICWAAKHCLNLEGDFVECGVYRGLSSFVAAKFVKFSEQKKRWMLYDSFERTENYSMPGLGDDLYHEVVERFSTFGNFEVIRGWVPDSFQIKSPERVSFLHIDMNNVPAEIGALEHLFDRVVPGGIIVLDDYGWNGHEAQAIAEDEFMEKRGYSVLELPTGQGLIFKR